MRKFFYLIMGMLLSLAVKAELINIGLYPDKKVTAFEFTPKAGKYTLFTENGKLMEISSKDVIAVIYDQGKIILKNKEIIIGEFDKLNFIGTGWYNHFQLSIQKPFQKQVRYDDNLKLVLLRNRMQLVNNIDLDNYIAGVVEAEVGRKPSKEYFKLQGIICRTYALNNLHKHTIEGYNLCDQVHCQVYHGKTFFEDIVSAVMQTRGIVIVDSDISLITAVFHSSCGGQTVNSEDVWSKSLYYLRSVRDSFCLNAPNAHWSKEVNANQWENYLSSKLSTSSISAKNYCSNEPVRKVRFWPTNSLTMEDIRNDWKLRSTYFNIQKNGEKVIIQGRGYGHGVGLCQIGAMEMANRGYSYSEILHYYYQGVHLIDLSALDFFRE